MALSKKNTVKMIGTHPPKMIRNETDAQQAIHELLSLTKEIQESSSNMPSIESSSSSSSTTTLANETISKNSNNPDDERQVLSRNNDTDNDYGYELLRKIKCIQKDVISYMVEEMPQICRFHLTLRLKTHVSQHQQGNLNISTEQSPGTITKRTLLVIQEKGIIEEAIFVGEFPYDVISNEITWQHEAEYETFNDTKYNTESIIVIHVRIPYQTDFASSSLLQESNVHNQEQNISPLHEINAAGCGACYQPLFLTAIRQSSMSNSSESIPVEVIKQVYPLPQGYWDEIAEYLICYSGVSYL
jgi:hypothetical protein